MRVFRSFVVLVLLAIFAISLGSLSVCLQSVRNAERETHRANQWLTLADRRLAKIHSAVLELGAKKCDSR